MNIQKIRNDFPILTTKMNGHQLIYFDNAATSQKPQVVIDSIANFYARDNAAIHRSIYTLGERATALYENARSRVATFINAHDSSEVAFTRGTTHGINMAARSYVQGILMPGDEIVLTELEHHSNLLIWQELAKETGAILKFIPVDDEGELAYDQLETIITSKTKCVAFTHESNAIGTYVDAARIAKVARAVGACILIDAAQTVPHQKVDVQALGCDFLTFSGHKMCGPTGIGILYVNKRLHNQLKPFEYGGGMLYKAEYKESQVGKMPQLLEAGSPPTAQAIGLHAAIEYLDPLLRDNAIRSHGAHLCARLIDGLQTIHGIRILGPINTLKISGHSVSFVMDGMHAHDVAAHCNKHGIAVRAGHMCAQPLAQKIGAESMVRVSFYLYNTEQEVDRLIDVLGALRV